jgi:hypothetical protein
MKELLRKKLKRGKPAGMDARFKNQMQERYGKSTFDFKWLLVPTVTCFLIFFIQVNKAPELQRPTFDEFISFIDNALEDDELELVIEEGDLMAYSDNFSYDPLE